jgi:hypothetical protein
MQSLKKVQTPPPRQPITIDSQPNGDVNPSANGLYSDSGILKTIGITVPVAATFFLADGIETALVDATFGLFMVCSFTLAAPLGYFCYVQQRKAGDSHHESLSKALFLSALTVIPVVCIASLVSVPMGICGFLAKRQETQR